MQPTSQRQKYEIKDLLEKNSYLEWREKKNCSFQTNLTPNQDAIQNMAYNSTSTSYINFDKNSDKTDFEFQSILGGLNSDRSLCNNLLLVESNGVNTFNESLADNDSIFVASVSKLRVQRNPFLASLKSNLTQIPENWCWEENDFQTDREAFEMDEPELINIFEKPFLLNNPFVSDHLVNPFSDVFIPLPNQFEIPQENTNPFFGATEEMRNKTLDSSEWQKHDEFFQKLQKSKRLDKQLPFLK
ncbi:hypothetical protein NPIL_109241 [Nephila pilipes]|uniref:Uncharacterized protein n=1 Tax=Nephila pilipes TaxID=299642 RepID=A0A8X6T3U9_NEPPI|nr:hypothetical protein NPIL_109241 [Nephila pilipes]